MSPSTVTQHIYDTIPSRDSVPICLLLSLPFTYIWLYQLSPVEAHYAAAYRFSCLAIASACILEMTAEAPIFVAQVFCFVRLKVILDTLHILVRSIVFVTLVTTGTTGAIHAFGIAQLASATTIVSGNYLFFHVYIGRLREYRTAVRQAKEDSHAAAADGDVPGVEDVPLVTAALKDHFGSSFEQMHDFPFGSVRDMCPGVLAGAESPFNSDLQRLVLSFAKQVVFKQVLTEGEKLVMSVSTKLSFSEQATYDIVNNMGSMAARFIFRPVEDSSYFYYTQTIARDVRLEQQAAAKVHECGRVLQNLCKAISSIGLLAFVFGQSYAGTVLLLYGGPEFVRDGLPETLLRWHSLAIVLLAVNGITEGFMFATTTSRDIDAYNWYMAGFSAIFLVLSYYLISLFGPVGFILANCTNMALRIAYSSQYIVQLFRPMGLNPLSGFVPGKLFLAVLGAAGLLCKVSEVSFVGFTIALTGGF